jgi:hypothetical protein
MILSPIFFPSASLMVRLMQFKNVSPPVREESPDYFWSITDTSRDNRLAGKSCQRLSPSTIEEAWIFGIKVRTSGQLPLSAHEYSQNEFNPAQPPSSR